MKRRAFIALWAALALGFSGLAQALTAEQIMRQSQAAYFYPGQDFKARVVMKLINKEGKERLRELTLLRRNAGPAGGEQKYLMVFFRPADVKGMSFMIHKYSARDDDRWMLIPALNLVKRIAAQDKRSSFVGSDFTYEDVSGRDLEDDSYALEREDELGDRPCYVVRSTPNAADADFGHKLTWVDKGHFLPLKEQQYDRQGGLAKEFSADQIAEVKGRPTVVRRTMRNLQTGHRTEVDFIKTDYDLGLDDGLFVERYLRQPPRQWLD